MKTVIEMAREAFDVAVDGRGRETFSGDSFGLEDFAELVRADEREKWMERTAILIRGEREACANVCEDNATDLSEGDWDSACINCADHIRARSNT